MLARNVLKAGKIWLGYRVMSIDYDKGSGTSKFAFDVVMHGPTVGFGWRF